jgi:NADPH-dependent 2,4-dienoyl-CoA reductase/sulfur reductase-like enzyme/ferredoxin
MRLTVDLNRCEGYAQCAFLAPDVFTMHGDEALLYDPNPSGDLGEAVRRAVAACPVQAIQLEDEVALDAGTARTPKPASKPVLGPDDRVVVVGASLAGLHGAEALRDEGFEGKLTIIGDERREPYDRPPLSKSSLLAGVPPEHMLLPRTRDVDADWRLGVAATGLDLDRKVVKLADGDEVPFDRLLIATGVSARPGPNAEEAGLQGVLTLRTIDDGRALVDALDAGPERVLVIGGGFTGAEIASACREHDVAVTLVERGSAPLVGALGGVVASVAADMQREHGVDLRCGVTVESLKGDGGRVTGAVLSDGQHIDADVAVVALGSVRNTQWLADSGLAAGPRGIACDAGCRAFTLQGIVTDDIFVAGDVARFPHPLYEYQMLALEHWGNAVEQAQTAAHNMLSTPTHRRPHLPVPAFWSSQFGVNIKSVGIPSFSDEVAIVQGSLELRRFTAVYGYRGRITAAVSFDDSRWLDFYGEQITHAAPFPPPYNTMNRSGELTTQPSAVPDPSVLSHGPTVVVTGHAPDERHVASARLDGHTAVVDPHAP